MAKKTAAKPSQLKSTSSKNPSKQLKSSTSHPKKPSKPSKTLKKAIKKPKIYKKTPIKPNSLIISSKRQPKKTEKAIESAEQANLFQILKTQTFTARSPEKSRKPTNNKKVSFNLKAVELIKGKSPKISKTSKKPLQSIMKAVVSSSLEDRVSALERQIQEIFAILKKNSKKT